MSGVTLTRPPRPDFSVITGRLLPDLDVEVEIVPESPEGTYFWQVAFRAVLHELRPEHTHKYPLIVDYVVFQMVGSHAWSKRGTLELHPEVPVTTIAHADPAEIDEDWPAQHGGEIISVVQLDPDFALENRESNEVNNYAIYSFFSIP